jgi:hypothetical protein
MRVVELAANSATIGLSFDEVYIIHNALNEVCNALDLEEFATRMGAEHGTVASLLGDTRSLIDRLEQRDHAGGDRA